MPPPRPHQVSIACRRSGTARARAAAVRRRGDVRWRQHTKRTPGRRRFHRTRDVPNIAAVDNTHVLYVYARSTQTGAEQVASVTVQVNKPLSVGAFTPTPTPPPVVFAIPVVRPTPTPTFPGFPRTELTSTPVPAAAPTNGGLTLQVSNPQPGDTIAHGMYVIQGVAFDSRAPDAGVRQVQVFLDPRDGGGQLLGEAQLAQDIAGGPFGFILIAPLPNRTGNHTLAIYARSDVVDQEVTVEVPITLE